MDQERFKEIFEEKYERPLGLTFEQWQEVGPKTEKQAYERLDYLDEQLKTLHDQREDARGAEKERLQDELDHLKIEYDLLEELFGLEAWDADW